MMRVVLSLWMVVALSGESSGQATQPNEIWWSESGGMVGGRVEITKIFRIQEDGTAQFWVEDSADHLHEFRAGRLDANRLFAGAAEAMKSPVAPEVAPPQRGPGPLPEYSPPRTSLRIRIGERTWNWAGKPEDLPAVWGAWLAKLTAMRQDSALRPQTAADSYLRCERLTPNVIAHLREAGLVGSLSAADMATRPLLGDAIRLSPAMLPVERGADPLHGLPRPKGTRSRAYVVVAEQCYMLRVFACKTASGSGLEPIPK